MTLVKGEPESDSKFSAPRVVADLLADDALRSQLPLRFVLREKPFNIEIQYFLDIENAENFNSSKGLIKFAVTTDGFDLLVDTRSEDLEVLQEEFGSIDNLGFCFRELMGADKERL